MPVKAIGSKEEFDRLITSGKVILVDFYADWCNPCREISPEFDKLAERFADQGDVEFYKVDIDKLGDVAQELKISSIPFFHAFKDGVSIDKSVGADKTKLLAFVESLAKA